MAVDFAFAWSRALTVGYVCGSAALPHAGGLDSGSPGAHLHRQSGLQTYFKDPELLPFELNMLEVALGEVSRKGNSVTSEMSII